MLSLSVPALESKPAIPAEVRPKQLQALIAGLPARQPDDAAKLILEELQDLNRQQVAPERRFQALEIYRRAILGIVGRMAERYCDQPLPLADAAITGAQTAHQLLTELAYGYKHALIAEQAKLFGLSSDKHIAVLIQRAMDTLSRRLLVDYHTYSATAAGCWSEMHQLYLYALQQSLQDIRIDEDSINLTYKRALLLALADTHHLPTTAMDQVVDYLQRFAQHAQLQPFGTPDNPAGIFLVHLNSDKPPTPLSKFRGGADLRTDILLITIEIARQVHQHLTRLQTEEPPQNLGLPQAATEQSYRDMLAHLLKQWGKAPKRQFNRIEKNEIINMCVGLPAMHYFLSGKTASTAQAPGDEISLNFADSPIDGDSASHKSARWMVVNESAGGLALSKFVNVQVALQVGELVGLKAPTGQHWSVAAMRWASTNDETPLSVGAQMLAPHAEAVWVRTSQQGEAQPALLLPELPALRQPATLVMACGSYQAAATLEIEHDDGKHDRVLQTRLVERTQSFERFQFSMQ